MLRTTLFITTLFALSSLSLQAKSRLDNQRLNSSQNHSLLSYQVSRVLDDLKSANGNKEKLRLAKDSSELLKRFVKNFRKSATLSAADALTLKESKQWLETISNSKSSPMAEKLNKTEKGNKTVQSASLNGAASISKVLTEAAAGKKGAKRTVRFMGHKKSFLQKLPWLGKVNIVSLGVIALSFSLIAGAIFFGAYFVLFKSRKSLQLGRLKGATRERKTLSSVDKNEALGNVSIRMFEASENPVAFLASSGSIAWANRAAVRILNLKAGDIFNKQEILKDEMSAQSTFTDERAQRHVVESQNIRLKGKELEMLVFIPFTASVQNKSYLSAENSGSLSCAIEDAIQKNNYLFSASSIPVSVSSGKEEVELDKAESKLVERFVFLCYQMAKDIEDARVDFGVRKNQGRIHFQADIRNLAPIDLDFDKKVLVASETEERLGELWTELELGLSKREGRVFMHEADGPRKGMSVLISFNARRQFLSSDQFASA